MCEDVKWIQLADRVQWRGFAKTEMNPRVQ